MFICDGFYGNLNAGDDFFQVIIAKAAKDKVVFTSNENITGHRLNYIGPNRFRGEQKLRMLCFLLRYRKFLTAGGSVFENKSEMFSFRRMAILLSYVMNIKIEAIGVSVNDTSPDGDAWFYDKILTRDKININKAHIDHGVDLAYLWLDGIKPIETSDYTNKLRKVGLIHCPFESVRGLDVNQEKERDTNFLRLARTIAKQNSVEEVVVMVLNGHQSDGDEAKANLIIQELVKLDVKLTKLRYVSNPVIYLNEIENLDFVISTRLHGAIFSHLSRTPFALFEYHRKCKDWLDDIGVPDYMRIADGNISDIDFLELIRNPKIVGYSEEFCSRIEKTKERLSAFINNNS